MPIFGILRIFVKKENIALFIASDMYRYSGNTKYLYQYFNTHSNDKCYWITESKEVINQIEKNINKPVITSNQAQMWSWLRRAGVNDKIIGFGDLFNYRLTN